MKSRKSIALAGKLERVTLRQPLALAGSPDLQVDREAGAIRNVSIITEGPAIGHGFFVDRTMVKQVAAGIRRALEDRDLSERSQRFATLLTGHPGLDDAIGTIEGLLESEKRETGLKR